MIRVLQHSRHHFITGLLLIIGLLAGIPRYALSQFLDLELTVDSELSAATEQPLNFGTLAPNSGRAEIPFGAVNMGIFSIRALENQNLMITLDMPDELPSDNPAIQQTIPLDLHARYGYSAQNYQVSTPLPELTSSITVDQTPGPGPWSIFYIFIYGSINIRDVPDGIYGSEILLNVEYI